MLTVYCYDKCTTCKKALKWLDDRNISYDKIALTTFGFQAPGFYQKNGYSIEFIREDKDPKLKKYFLIKILKSEK